MQGKIALVGFKLEPIELEIAYKIIETYSKKIERVCDVESIKLELRKSSHGKTFLHEISANARVNGGVLTAKTTEYNLFKALSNALEKILNESVHRKK